MKPLARRTNDPAKLARRQSRERSDRDGSVVGTIGYPYTPTICPSRFTLAALPTAGILAREFQIRAVLTLVL